MGAIVVFWRGSANGWSGHVGFVVGKAQHGNLMVLGGNQGDMVSIKPFGRDRVLGYRWPAGVPVPARSSRLFAATGASVGSRPEMAPPLPLPSWRIRRTIIVSTLIFCAAKIIYLTIWGKDTDLAATIANGLIILAGSVIGAYVFGVVWGDRNVMAMSRGMSGAGRPQDPPDSPKDLAG